LTGWNGLAESDFSVLGALVVARFGSIIALVQWIDEPDEVTMDEVISLARLIEDRAYSV
jgi:hypothetical protein